MIQPLIIGNRQFASNLIQAPLAGVSSAAFRELISQFSGQAYCVTEMVSAKTLLHHPARRYLYKDPNEGPLCFQLSGNDPNELAKAAEQAVNLGADLIDLNCGCPVDKIRKKNCGSKLLAMSTHLATLIKAIKQVITLPLSVKIRVDGDSGDQFNADVVKAVNDAGADFIIVHGRHWTEDYSTPVRLDEIAAIVATSAIPVIGNGDVHDAASLKRLFLQTGCHGAMIGRASVGRPWLFQQLIAKSRGENFVVPTRVAIGSLFLQHIQHLIDWELESEKMAVFQARSLSKYYLRAALLNRDSHLLFQQVASLTQLTDLVAKIF